MMVMDYRHRMHELQSPTRSTKRKHYSPFEHLRAFDKKFRSLLPDSSPFYLDLKRDSTYGIVDKVSVSISSDGFSRSLKERPQQGFHFQRMYDVTTERNKNQRHASSIRNGLEFETPSLKSLGKEASQVSSWDEPSQLPSSIVHRPTNIHFSENSLLNMDAYKGKCQFTSTNASSPQKRRGSIIQRRNAPLFTELRFSRADSAAKGITKESYLSLLWPKKDVSDINQASSSGSQSREITSMPKWKELYQDTQKINPQVFTDEAETLEAQLEQLSLTRQLWKKPEEDTDKLKKDAAFAPLSKEAEEEVRFALTTKDRRKVLVVHENSNVEITGAVIQCLAPGVWLNDDVINVYMELLKEREHREPENFLCCHFFNTFFYNKLFKDKGSYDYKAVRRWTTERRIGYKLNDCEKILVPIHKDIHWCLAVIDMKGQKLEYLDSLGGRDNNVLQVLARYIVDEVKEKSGKDLDVGSWTYDFPRDIPEQLNGCDCGMFMLKYADFHSRGIPLSFTQDNMEYFRRRTVYEIVKLKAT